MASYSETLTDIAGVLDNRSWNDMTLTWDDYTGTWDSYGEIPITSLHTHIRTLTSGITQTEAIQLIAVAHRNLTDGITHTLSLANKVIRTLTDSITHTTFLTKTVIKSVNDSISHTETVLKNVIRALADSITHTVSLIKSVVRTLTDSITQTEAMNKVLTAVRELFDWFPLTQDTIIKIIKRMTAEAITHTESFAKTTTKVLTDPWTITEVFKSVTTFIRNLTDTLSVAEYDWTWDKMTLTWDDYTQEWDAYRNSFLVRIITLRNYTDAITLSGSIIKKAIKNLSETITQAETFDRIIKLLRTDAIALVENISFQLNLTLIFNDAIALTENFTKLFKGYITSTIGKISDIIPSGMIRKSKIEGRILGRETIGKISDPKIEGNIKNRNIIGRIKRN